MGTGSTYSGGPSRVMAVVLFAVVVAATVLVGSAFANDQATYDLIPENTYISGVNVSGMTEEEAIAAVSATAEQLSADVDMTLVASDTGESYSVTLNGGVTYDITHAARAAVELNHNTPVLTRIAGGVPERTDIEIEFAVDPYPIREQVEQIAGMLYVAPVNAEREWHDDNTVSVSYEVVGRGVDVDATVAAAEAALQEQIAVAHSLADLANAQITATMTAGPLQPDVTVADMPLSVIIDYAQYMLYVFDLDQCVYQCGIGYGRGWEDGVEYNSPMGLHYIEYFDPSPTWSNPSPNGWGSEYKAFYAGGEEGNPLGVRAMKVSDALMVYIHGVEDPNLIGQRLSHGCINIYNPVVIELYDLLFNSAVEYDSLSVDGNGEPIYVYFHNYPG